MWTRESLDELVKEKLSGYLLVVVSNREPYIHTFSGHKIVAEVPASGLTVALDPVMQACGGSTGGVIKVVRVSALVKDTRVMMRKAISPKAVIPLKYNRKPLSEGVVRDVISFFFLYILVAVVASITLSFLGLNLETAMSAVATCQANCGPGLGVVGPALNYACLIGAAKVILSMCM